MSDIVLAQSFTVQVCINCGIAFAVPEYFDRKRREDGATFYCPNGHAQCYSETRVAQLERELAAKQRLLEQSHNREAALAGTLKKTEAAKKRLAKRLESGVCPVPGCKRHFTNLQRHIATEHKGVAIPELSEGQGHKLLQ